MPSSKLKRYIYILTLALQLIIIVIRENSNHRGYIKEMWKILNNLINLPRSHMNYSIIALKYVIFSLFFAILSEFFADISNGFTE